MERRRVLAITVAAGLLVGVLAVVLPAAFDESEAVTTTTVASTTTTEAPDPRVVWVSPLEARIGPAVVIPTGLTLDGGVLTLTYDVESVAPTSAAAAGFPTASDSLTGPGEWMLTAGGETYRSASISPTNRSVRFTVGDDFLIGTIEDVRIETYHASFPIYLPWDVEPDDEEWATLGPGLRLRLVGVTEQPNNYLVRVQTDLPTALVQQMTVEGRGREFWNSSVSMINLPQWTIDYRVDELPETIPLVARGLMWIEIDADVSVSVEGIEG